MSAETSCPTELADASTATESPKSTIAEAQYQVGIDGGDFVSESFEVGDEFPSDVAIGFSFD